MRGGVVFGFFEKIFFPFLQMRGEVFVEKFADVAQLARALAFQAKGRGFESRLPLHLSFSKGYELYIPNNQIIA